MIKLEIFDEFRIFSSISGNEFDQFLKMGFN
jgi:hypothetical protein